MIAPKVQQHQRKGCAETVIALGSRHQPDFARHPQWMKRVPHSRLSDTPQLLASFAIMKHSIKRNLTLWLVKVKRLKIYSNKNTSGPQGKKKKQTNILFLENILCCYFSSQRKHMHVTVRDLGARLPWGQWLPPSMAIHTSLLTFWNQELCVPRWNVFLTFLPSNTIHNIL